jgi:hypothetical protein
MSKWDELRCVVTSSFSFWPSSTFEGRSYTSRVMCERHLCLGLGKNAQVIRHRLERIAELYAFLAIQIVNMVLLVVNIVIYPDSVLRSHSCNTFKNWKSLYSSELRQYWPSHYCFWITADGHGIDSYGIVYNGTSPKVGELI